MKILFVSLGCDKNLVDSEEMLGDLTAAGHEITDDEDLAEAEDADEDDEDIEAGGALVYKCPHCQEEIELDPDELDLEEDHPCPNCGKELFPELLDEVD